MRIIKKDKVDIKQYLREMKANRTLNPYKDSDGNLSQRTSNTFQLHRDNFNQRDSYSKPNYPIKQDAMDNASELSYSNNKIAPQLAPQMVAQFSQVQETEMHRHNSQIYHPYNNYPPPYYPPIYNPNQFYPQFPPAIMQYSQNGLMGQSKADHFISKSRQTHEGVILEGKGIALEGRGGILESRSRVPERANSLEEKSSAVEKFTGDVSPAPQKVLMQVEPIKNKVGAEDSNEGIIEQVKTAVKKEKKKRTAKIGVKRQKQSSFVDMPTHHHKEETKTTAEDCQQYLNCLNKLIAEKVNFPDKQMISKLQDRLNYGKGELKWQIYELEKQWTALALSVDAS